MDEEKKAKNLSVRIGEEQLEQIHKNVNFNERAREAEIDEKALVNVENSHVERIEREHQEMRKKEELDREMQVGNMKFFCFCSIIFCLIFFR